MKKLPLPARTYSEMLNKCSEGMMQINVRNNFITHFPTFLQKEQQYRILSSTGQLFTYDRTHPLEPTTLVVGNLTKVKLEKLYENNLRGKNSPPHIKSIRSLPISVVIFYLSSYSRSL
jgi:hypothetical protein